jgi:elongation factor G
MKVYESAQIRNLALLGHQGAGKTTLAEAMLFHSGAINRMGSVQEGSTVSDYHTVENQRQMSIFASLLHAEWEGHKINVLDAPGYPDFVGEVTTSLRVADTAVFVLHASDGVQVGTDVAWSHGEKAKVPSIFVINHIDKPGLDFNSVIEQVQGRFGHAATLAQFPVAEGSRSIVDLLLMKQLTFPDGAGTPEVKDIDPALLERATALRNNLIENIAENSEALMERYLEQGELSAEEIQRGLKAAILARQLFPIFVCSATTHIGVQRLMTIMTEHLPSPLDVPPPTTVDGEPLACNAAGPPIAFVFRTMSEPHVGEYSFLRVCSGTLEQGLDLENAQTQNMERLGGLFVLNGRNRDAVPKLVAGDIGTTVKLKETRTSNTLRLKGNKAEMPPVVFSGVRYTAALKAVTAGEEDKLSAGLQRIVAEDPSMLIIHDGLLNQMLLAGQGEMQLEIARFRLKERYGVEVALSIPKVSYRETIQTSARSSYRHKKQTGGAGQFADVSLAIEPLRGKYNPPADIKVRNETQVETNWGAKLEMIDAIVSGVIDMKRFASAIQKGVLQAMGAGPIAGYPVGDVRVVVYDGKMHPVDSNETAFRTAGRQCFREAFQKAQPVMLEPIVDLEVLLPDAYTGDVMGDLNTRRARIQGMQAEGSLQKISATAPEAELLRYATTLRSLTQGRGLHSVKFNAYEPMPRNVQDKVVEENKRQKEEEED